MQDNPADGNVIFKLAAFYVGLILAADVAAKGKPPRAPLKKTPTHVRPLNKSIMQIFLSLSRAGYGFN